MTTKRGIGAMCGVLLATIIVSEAIGGGANDAETEAEKVLRRLPGEDQLLINLDAVDLPSTTDMIRLGRGATPAIINGLVNSMSAEVRAACAAVLTGTRDPRAVGALLDALDDPRQRVRSLAITALGQLETREATPRLLALLDKPNTSAGIKTDALVALGRLGDKQAIKPLFAYFERTWEGAAQDALWDLRRHLSKKQLRRLVVEPLEAAGAATDDGPGYGVLATSIHLAATLEIKAARAHLQRLYPKQSGLQNKILNALGRIGDDRAVPFLRPLLDPASPARVLNNVAFALDRLGEDVEPFLVKALGDRRAYIRFNAAFVAGDLKKKALIPALGKALQDPNDYVRSNAAVALGNIGDAAAVAALEAAGADQNPVVRGDALLALARVDYAKYGPRLLTEAVESKHRGTRYKAIRLFVERKDPKVVGPVLAALSPEDYRDRDLGLTMLRGFDDLDDPAATAFLLRAAASGGERQAFILLGRFADERSRFVLRQWLTQPESHAEQLLRAAGRLQDAASIPAITAWTGEKKPLGAQLHAAFALAAIRKDPAAGERLGTALEKAPLELKRVAARLLTELDLATLPALKSRLTALLAHEDVYVRLYSARALFAGGDAGAAELLRGELAKKVPFIRDEALDILERAPPAYRDTTLKAWLDAADPHLRRELRRILDA